MVVQFSGFPPLVARYNGATVSVARRPKEVSVTALRGAGVRTSDRDADEQVSGDVALNVQPKSVYESAAGARRGHARGAMTREAAELHGELFGTNPKHRT